MNSKVTYHQQVSYCGKPRCRKCREGTGHGPYWYAYQTVEGRTTRTYVGKHLPPDVQAEIVGVQEPATPQAVEREQSTIRIYVLGQFRLERRDPHIERLPSKYPEYREWPFPPPKPGDMAVFELTPIVISLLDYTKGFGHSELVFVARSDIDSDAAVPA